MAVITKIGAQVDPNIGPITNNINLLSPLGFRLILNRAANVEYFCQAATIPTLSMTEVNQPNPLALIPRRGDKLVFEPLSVRFRVDEFMTNYLEIYNWLHDLGHPEDLEKRAGSGEIFSDMTLLIMTSNNNAKMRINFEDAFPLNLSPLQFDVTQTDVEYLEAEATFRFFRFTVEKL